MANWLIVNDIQINNKTCYFAIAAFLLEERDA